MTTYFLRKKFALTVLIVLLSFTALLLKRLDGPTFAQIVIWVGAAFMGADVLEKRLQSIAPPTPNP